MSISSDDTEKGPLEGPTKCPPSASLRSGTLRGPRKSRLIIHQDGNQVHLEEKGPPEKTRLIIQQDGNPVRLGTVADGCDGRSEAPSWWVALEDDPGLLGRVRRQWPWVVVLALVAVGLLLVALRWWRWGAALIGAGMVAAGIFRSAIADPGILAIRHHRWIDLCFYFGSGIATIVFAVIVPAS